MEFLLNRGLKFVMSAQIKQLQSESIKIFMLFFSKTQHKKQIVLNKMEEMLRRIQGKNLICGKSLYMTFKARN